VTNTTTTSALAGRNGRVGLTALTAIAPAVWGTTYIVTTELLPAGHPLFAALMRALPAGILALLISRTLPHGAWWWKTAVLGTLNIGAFFPLLFLTAERLPGGVAATLGATQPIIVAFLVIAILHERLSPWRVSWGIVGVIGVGLVVLGPGAASCDEPEDGHVVAGLSAANLEPGTGLMNTGTGGATGSRVVGAAGTPERLIIR